MSARVSEQSSPMDGTTPLGRCVDRSEEEHNRLWEVHGSQDASKECLDRTIFDRSVFGIEPKTPEWNDVRVDPDQGRS